jgi:hypothetical protein
MVAMKLVNIQSTGDKKKIQSAVCKHLEQYRMIKSLVSFEIPAVCEDKQKTYHEYCKRVEDAVNELPSQEKFLVTERYLQLDSDYIMDYAVYKERFDPPISAATYNKYRNRAMIKLATLIGIDCR